MATEQLHINVPEKLKGVVEQEAETRGYMDTSEFIRYCLREEIGAARLRRGVIEDPSEDSAVAIGSDSAL